MSRAELIRNRCKGRGIAAETYKPRGLACGGHSQRKPQAPLSLARPGWMGFPNSHNPFGTATRNHQAQWIARPEKTTQSPHVTVKRRKGVSALTKISQQLPMKLPKIV